MPDGRRVLESAPRPAYTAVAQLAEQRFPKPQVGGSSPSCRGVRRTRRPGTRTATGQVPEARQANEVALEIYKRGQGKYTRTVTFVAGMMVAGLLARFLWQQLDTSTDMLSLVYGLPVALFVIGSLLMFWIVNRPSSADFMIATEGEMKKVSWSSKKEIIGGTKVVIATTLIMAALLRAVDVAFSLFFRSIGVLESTG